MKKRNLMKLKDVLDEHYDGHITTNKAMSLINDIIKQKVAVSRFKFDKK